MGKFKEFFDQYGYGEVATIEKEHAEIHKGDMWNRDFYFPAINDPSGARIGFKASGLTNYSHIIWGGSVSAGARIELYESVTFLGTGAKIYGRNNDRSVRANSRSVIFSGVRCSGASQTKATGTLISTMYYGAAGKDASPGGGSRGQEFILLPDVNYMFWIRPAADATIGHIALEWYEE